MLTCMGCGGKYRPERVKASTSTLMHFRRIQFHVSLAFGNIDPFAYRKRIRN